MLLGHYEFHMLKQKLRVSVNPFSLSERDRFASALVYLVLATAEIMISQ